LSAAHSGKWARSKVLRRVHLLGQKEPQWALLSVLLWVVQRVKWVRQTAVQMVFRRAHPKVVGMVVQLAVQMVVQMVD
jgi:hypothetical protein